MPTPSPDAPTLPLYLHGETSPFVVLNSTGAPVTNDGFPVRISTADVPSVLYADLPVPLLVGRGRTRSPLADQTGSPRARTSAVGVISPLASASTPTGPRDA